jgi:DNA-binding NarL/FixJ family response regulator
MDITLPGRNGIEAAAILRRVSPESRIVFVSQHDSTQVAREALSVGGIGYVVKSDAGHDLLAAIQAAREGRIFVSQKLLARGWKALAVRPQ